MGVEREARWEGGTGQRSRTSFGKLVTVLPEWEKGTRKALLGRGGSKRKSIRAVNGLGV